MSPHPKQSDDNENNVEAFDWKEIRALCLAPEPRHPAYGMQISEYRKKRNDVINDDDNKKIRLGVRVPNIVADIIPRLSRKFSLTVYRYLVLSLELGLITFQKDYHKKYSTINTVGDHLYDLITTREDQQAFSQLTKQTIILGSGSRIGTKAFIPLVPEWVAMAIKSTALEIHCSGTDLAYLCLCISIKKAAEEHRIPKPYLDDVDAVIATFDFEINELEKRIEDMKARIEK